MGKAWARLRKRSAHGIPDSIYGPANAEHRASGSKLPYPFSTCPSCEVVRPIEADGSCCGCGAQVFERVRSRWLHVSRER
jgi:hypothetical protein